MNSLPADGNASELVGDGDGVVVENAGRRNPSRRGVVGEYDELVLERPVHSQSLSLPVWISHRKVGQKFHTGKLGGFSSYSD